MLGTALYYPHIDVHNGEWLRSAVLFWDQIQTIVPTSIEKPYNTVDTKICEEEGYLRPLRCDLHPEVLDELGRRVFKFLERKEWQQEIIDLGSDASHASTALMHADKLSEEMGSRLESLVGVHPAKMPAALRSALIESGGLEMLSVGKLPPHMRRMFQDSALYGMHPEKLSREIRQNLSRHAHHDDGEWILVNGRFANMYMAALAALLSKEVQLSALTNEVSSAGVNLRCLVDDVAASGETAARGALVSVVMQGLKIDPEVSLKKLIAFRRGREHQIAELSGLFDDLKGKIENSSSSMELEAGAKRLFENKIQPGLNKLKKELEDQSIQSVWDGVQRGFTVSAATSSALAYITGYTGPMLLGAAACITLADVGIKSYLSNSKTRASAYSYLLDVERKFSLPR